MAAPTLWTYRNQILRIVQESLEVSLILCGSEMGTFTTAKIFDVFNQLLPTAFVLNTGYWAFYNTMKRQPICVCARYAIPCRHYKQDHHWIDMESIPGDNSAVFTSKNGNLIVTKSEIEVTPVTWQTAGYILAIRLTFQYKKIEKGRLRKRKNENLVNASAQDISIAIYCRYNVYKEAYPAPASVVFQPNPFFYDTYGSQFPELLQYLPSDMNPKSFCVPLEHTPNFSLILCHVNLPLHLPTTTLSLVQSRPDVRLRKIMCHKGTQTEDSSSLEIWKCQEIIAGLKPLWNDLDIEEASGKGNGIEQYTFPALNDQEVSTTTSINEDIAQKVQEKEYESHWPQYQSQKTITKRRRKKKPTPSLVPINTNRPIHHRVKNEHAPNLSYATVVKASSRALKTKEESIDIACWIKKEPMNFWTEEQISEHFDLAQELIDDDLATQQMKCWWDA
ncbi:uncharacterized protein LOC115877827 [Sitophilus oryzae]|uniref:Uncharacterized protein LOC115877827 n=1 Tax=Sitophilus oryzae TaxID=7048 RepID=A0A6J2XH22_SITOR|nr:uncharacterized protein LOC115877827 [Sitophilus oryzae]